MKTFKQILKEQEQHKVGDFWQTKPGIWAGKNPDGKIEYYGGGNAKQMSQAWAKGQTKKRGKVSAGGDSKDAGGKEPEKKSDTKSDAKDSGETKEVEKLEMKDGNHLIVSAATKKHISTHNEIGIGSVFSKDIDIDKVLAKVLPNLDVKDIKDGVYTTKSPGIGYNLVLSMDKAKKLSGAKMTSVEKEERDGPIKVPAIKTTAPLSDFKTDQLTLIIRPTNPGRLHPSLEKDKDTHNAIKAGKSFTLLASFPGDPSIPRASEWGDKYAVILPPEEKGGKEPEGQQTATEPEGQQTAPEPVEKPEPVRKSAPEKDDYSGQGVRNIISSSDKETLETNLMSHGMQTVPQLDNDRRVDRGFSDEEILEIHAHDPELAKKFGRVIEMEDGSLKGVGGGYAHAQKHGHEFEHAGGFDHVIKETLNTPDMHLKSRGTNMEITRVKNVDGKEKFVVMISDSDDKFITMYNADAATEAQAGNKSILKTFQNMAKSGDAGVQVKGDEAHLIMQEGDSGVKKIVYRREGNKVTIESKVMSKEDHQAEMDGFESASKSQLKKGNPFKGMFADVPPNNHSVNLESLITTTGTVKEEYVIESINEAKYYRNYLNDMQDDKLRNAIVGSGVRVYTDSGPDGSDARQYVIKNGSVTGWEEENGKYVINKNAFYSKDKDPTEKNDMSKKDKLTLHPKMDETMERYVNWIKI